MRLAEKWLNEEDKEQRIRAKKATLIFGNDIYKITLLGQYMHKERTPETDELHKVTVERQDKERIRELARCVGTSGHGLMWIQKDVYIELIFIKCMW